MFFFFKAKGYKSTFWIETFYEKNVFEIQSFVSRLKTLYATCF